MSYDPSFPRQHYDRVADEEWSRMTGTLRGQLSFLIHLDLLKQHLKSDMRVLEIGVGAGIFTKELVHMVHQLVVSDISEVQLSLNKKHMQELGVLDSVHEYRVLDLVDLSELTKGSFDAVVCIGGPLSYLLDKEPVALQQIIQILKPGGIAVLGVMSLINTVVRLLGYVRSEKEAIGIENMRWMLESGHQDREHNPSTEHYCHMMTSLDVDKLLRNKDIDVLEKRSPGLLGLAGEDALNDVYEDAELWDLLVERELAWSKLPGTLDLGDNILYVIRKRRENGSDEIQNAVGTD